MNINCECAKVNNGNRIGVHIKYTSENDFTDSEVYSVKKLWNKVGYGEMTDVYKCSICGQLWGASPTGNGWMSYRRLPQDYEYKNK